MIGIPWYVAWWHGTGAWTAGSNLSRTLWITYRPIQSLERTADYGDAAVLPTRFSCSRPRSVRGRQSAPARSDSTPAFLASFRLRRSDRSWRTSPANQNAPVLLPRLSILRALSGRGRWLRQYPASARLLPPLHDISRPHRSFPARACKDGRRPRRGPLPSGCVPPPHMRRRASLALSHGVSQEPLPHCVVNLGKPHHRGAHALQ